MDKITIDISAIISQDLKSRVVVRDFELYIKNLHVPVVIVDFRNVKFATRSFIDEFYNTFLKSENAETKVELENIPSDLQAIFEAVKLTQNRPKSKDNTGAVVYLDNISDIKKFFSTLAL
ncbi:MULTISPECIES: hypothetical protein [Butyricimonas]|mgnify:CR=1 FL=1|uniref:DUF4325 domain-containing protein n=1 Tax=Butyricimonas hominis TaxID=2763032 RepID=A0ABR7D6G1_9BACT|nr:MULTISPECIES: hypothetical protein [Butyricimonas]MBC5623552.1 hypothetical protein [Butyricimonas hominis]